MEETLLKAGRKLRPASLAATSCIGLEEVLAVHVHMKLGVLYT